MHNTKTLHWIWVVFYPRWGATFVSLENPGSFLCFVFFSEKNGHYPLGEGGRLINFEHLQGNRNGCVLTIITWKEGLL